MADLPKRVWSGKKLLFSWKKAIWEKDWKVWVFDPNFKEVDSWEFYSPNKWDNLPDNAELQVYDDKDAFKTVDIGTFEDWLESTYKFVDWDGTILKQGKVKDGETPVAPADPTREPTAQYTYTFTGWNPTVWPINKNTTFSAVYSSTVNTYTVTFDVNDADYGSVSPASVANVPYWTAISSSDNVITVWETTVTATASEWYQFSSWGTLPATVTWNVTITATFEQSAVPVNIIWDTNKLAGGYADPTLTGSITAGNSIFYWYSDKWEDYYMDAVFYADAQPWSYDTPTGVLSFYDEDLSESLWRPISNVEYDQEYPTKFFFNYFLPDFTWLWSTDDWENYDEITSWDLVPEVSDYYMTLWWDESSIAVDFQAVAWDDPAISDDYWTPIVSLESWLVFNVDADAGCYTWSGIPLFKLENLSESIASYISVWGDGLLHVTAGITSQKQWTANWTLYISDGEGGMMRLWSIYLGITINPA